jgi:hypothetical protein
MKTAPAIPELVEKKYKFAVKCLLSGLPLGTLELADSRIAGAGKYAYAQTWKQNTCLHPIFSLSIQELLDKQLYIRFYKKQYSEQEKCLLFLAMANSTGALIVDKDRSGLPSFKVALRWWNPMVDIIKWWYYLDSRLFKFPRVRISKETNWDDAIRNWISACHDARNDWERQATKYERKDRANIARKIVEKKIKHSHLGVELNFSALFDWATAETALHLLQKKTWMKMNNSKTRKLYPTGAFMSVVNGKNTDIVYYQTTQEETYRTLFCASDSEVTAYSQEEITDLADFLTGEMELGTSISHEVSKRIKYLKDQLKKESSVFELLGSPDQVESIERMAQITQDAPIEEPIRGQFKSAIDFHVAHAKWRLSKKAA